MLWFVFDNRKLPTETTCINSTSITQPTLSFYLQETSRICNFHANCYDYNRIACHWKFTKYPVKLDQGKNILYLLTGPMIIVNGLRKCTWGRSFLTRDALLSAVYAVVVCLSVCVCVCVCVSVTLRYRIKTAKRKITQITPHDSPLTLVFWHQSSLRNSNEITPYGGDKCRWGGLKFVTLDENRAITRKRYKIDE